MKKLTFLTAFVFSFFLLLLPLVSIAGEYDYNSGYTYDWQSGNSYNWYRDYSGNTHVRGFNYNTGSQWNTTIEPDGDMRGYDKNFNYWRYNESTGVYMNYGTGEMRFRGQDF